MNIRPTDLKRLLPILPRHYPYLSASLSDRTIAATAVLNACPIVTSDPALRAFYPQTIW